MKGTKNIASRLKDELIDIWLNTRTTPADVFEDLARSRSPIREVSPREDDNCFETLSRTLGDRNVAMVLNAAKNNDKTRKIATELEAAQPEMWWNSGKSVDVDDFNVLYHQEKATMIYALRYSFKDRILLTTLDTAKKNFSTEKLAANLQTALVDKWLAGPRLEL